MKSKLYNFSAILIFAHTSLIFTLSAPERTSEAAREESIDQNYQATTGKTWSSEALQDQMGYGQDSSSAIASVNQTSNQADIKNSTTFSLPKETNTSLSRITPVKISPLTLSDISTGLADASRIKQEIAGNTNMRLYYQELAQQATQHASDSLEITLRLFKLLNNYNPADKAAQTTLANTFKAAFDEARQAYDKTYTALAKSPELQTTATAQDLAHLAYKTLTAFKKAFDMCQKLDKNLNYSISYLVESTLDDAKSLNQQF